MARPTEFETAIHVRINFDLKRRVEAAKGNETLAAFVRILIEEGVERRERASTAGGFPDTDPS